MDSFKDVLEAAQSYCKAQMAEPTYNLYIDGLEPISFEDSSHITLSVRNDFICKIVTDRYLGLLKEAFKTVLGFDVDITLVVPSTPPHEVVLAQQYEANPASPQGNYEFTFGEIRKKVGEIYDAGAVPIILGGDHGIAYPTISELAKRHPGKVGVLHFDAHLDNYSNFGDDPYSRCSPFYQLYNDPNMDPTKIVHIGIRGPRNHQEEFNNAKKYGANVILCREIKKNGWEASIKKAIELASKDTEVMYVTICADSLDAAFMPQGPQDMGGLTSFELLMMVHEAGLAGARALDFVEIYPDAYSLQPASHVGCWLALYFLNGVAERRKNGEK